MPKRTSSGDEHAYLVDATVHVLRILHANIRQLVVSKVEPKTLGIEAALETVTSLLKGCVQDLSLPMRVRLEALEAFHSGGDTLFPGARAGELSRVLATDGVVLEFQFWWPGLDVPGQCERAALLLQVAARKGALFLFQEYQCV